MPRFDDFKNGDKVSVWGRAEHRGIVVGRLHCQCCLDVNDTHWMKYIAVKLEEAVGNGAVATRYALYEPHQLTIDNA